MTTPAPSAVRAWARDNGHRVPSRGRIRSEVLTAYAAAQPPAPPPALPELSELAVELRALASDFAALRGELAAVTDSVAGLSSRVAELEAADVRPARGLSLRRR